MQLKFISSFQVNPPMSSLVMNKNKPYQGGYLCSNRQYTQRFSEREMMEIITRP